MVDQITPTPPVAEPAAQAPQDGAAGQSPNPQPAPAAAPENSPQNQTTPNQEPTGNNPQSDDTGQETFLPPGDFAPQPEEVLFEWQALSRPFKKHNRQFFSTVGIIALLMAIILIIAGQIPLVGVIAAVVFVYYVLNTTHPETVTHQLTTFGIRVEKKLYYWEELGRFWFKQKAGHTVLHIEVDRFPWRLSLLLGETNKELMQKVLAEILLNEEPPPTTYEKAAQWLQKKLPLELDGN